MEQTFWDESSINNTIKCEGNLSFTTVASEDDEYAYHKKKLSRDPLSHRIIEKRRRDRMNNCLADLSRLLPSEYMKKGRGRIEKTEIIEMAIKHMKHLQAHPCTEASCCPVEMQHSEENKSLPILSEHYKLGFHECLSETMHFLVEVEGFFAGDTLCVQLISHLHRHCDNILKGDLMRLNNGGTAGGGVSGAQPSPMKFASTSNQDEPLPDREKTSGRFTPKDHQLPLDQTNNRLPDSRILTTSPQSHPESSNGGESSVSYKFKNIIRKRFATERAAAPRPSTVPIFALSPKGSYYLPLSLDYSLISNQVGEYSALVGDDDEAVLHPVTISVNFRPSKLRREEFSMDKT